MPQHRTARVLRRKCVGRVHSRRHQRTIPGARDKARLGTGRRVFDRVATLYVRRKADIVNLVAIAKKIHMELV